ncbi:MAG: serine/threonine-protein kinase, partial [Pirellulaceae bacterium]|nr:serine/threonine-protein kinase [Pirellulaceae bacterium]
MSDQDLPKTTQYHPLDDQPLTGSSVGRRAILPSDERTVISKRRPLPSPEMLRPVKPNEIGASLAGEQLGHFELEEFIGGGGMGAVFRAVDNTLGRTVAVKVVSNESTDEETLRRFRNEAQSAARLDHSNIARVYYVGEDQGWNYIVFEYIEGVNIRDLVEHKGPLLPEEAVSYMLQVAEALDHASERDVVHRDIKPSNVLVMPDGRAKLVDMGLARLHHVDSPANDLTATGVTLGTFDYISPEQARDPRCADVRSDLYSLGCTLYYMLTGMPPFPEGTVLQKLLSHSSDPPPDPRELRPEIPDEIAA